MAEDYGVPLGAGDVVPITVEDYEAKSAFAEIERRPKAAAPTAAQVWAGMNPAAPTFFRSES